MKSLKLNHDFAMKVLSGQKLSTWRVNDDKDLHVNEEIQLIDKVDPHNPETWIPIGYARITAIIEKQIGKIMQYDLPANEVLRPVEDTLEEYRGYYGRQINTETPVKVVVFDFVPLSRNSNEPAVKYEEGVKLYADGGSRGNPGPSASGFVLLDAKGDVIFQDGVYIGVTTNNQAEYHSLRLGLEAAAQRGIKSLDVFMDSMLVVNQMNGIYKVRNSDLRPVYLATKNISSVFDSISFSYIPRERNRRADLLVNKTLDAVPNKKKD